MTNLERNQPKSNFAINCFSCLILSVLFIGAYTFPLCAAPLDADTEDSDQEISDVENNKLESNTKKTSANGACKAEVLIDYATGEVLSERNARVSLPPASMIKMLVAYVAMKQASAGSVSLDDIITASAHASKVGGSQVYLRDGEQFTLRQLLEALMIQSANDAAMAIAEHIGGSAEGFVEIMNQEATALGMTQTRVASPHGLPPGKGQVVDLTSAYDMALLARAIIRDYPELHKLSGQNEGTFRDGSFGMRNHNDLIRTFKGCDGIKTGYFREAGFCVTATAERKGVRVIAVTMGCNSKQGRRALTSRLLSQGLSQFRSIKLTEAEVPSANAVPVKNGSVTEINPVTAKELSATTKIGDEKNIIKEASLCSGLIAPIAAGTKCGEIKFMLGDRELGRVDYVIKDNIAKATWRDKVRSYLPH